MPTKDFMDYHQRKYLLQVELRKWQAYAANQETKHIIVFEGRNTAGKSSTIAKFMEHMNPRTACVVALPQPSPDELKQWYFQKYIAKFPKAGEIAFFDRSWYNRAGVEPVMGFCTQKQTNRFLEECSQLESLWIDSGIKIIKFYFSVDKYEQKQRLDARATDPLKLGKITAVDLASQPLWDEYTRAKDRMFKFTSTKKSPWITIDSNNKHDAVIAAMQYVLLQNDYPGKDLAAIGVLDSSIIG
jgi:polyphosphate kinase